MAMSKEPKKPSIDLINKTTHLMHDGMDAIAFGEFEIPPALGDARWTDELILSTWHMSATGKVPENLNYKTGDSNGGFDKLEFKYISEKDWIENSDEIETGIPLNRRGDERAKLNPPIPIYGGGMSYGSVSVNVMMARAMNAKKWNTYMSTGEGGYPEELYQCKDHVITQVATGYFGVEERSIQAAPIVEFKYAQGAKPGLGGHLLASKAGEEVAKMRGSVPFVSLFSPFPFHSTYSVEDHSKHIDWIQTVNPNALISVKVSTPHDVDMVAVGSYYAGAHIIHLDGGFGGTGAAMYVASIFGYDGYIEINAFITGALAIGIISGAYSTEVFRGAILSIDKGQFEASKVLGIKKYIQFYKIILPQMLRLSIPNLSNVWQITLKDTSLISVTGFVEIMRQYYIADGSTRDPLFFYSVAAVLYLMLTFLSMK